MSRAANLSPLGLYNWDNTIFNLMVIPEAMDKDVLINNLLAETAELEVLYPNPIVFKNLVGIWSHKQIDVWNKLWETTQFEYNPIENYNRIETGTTGGTGRTTHSGTDTTADTTNYGGTDGRTESIMHGGSDVVTRQTAEGGNQGETTNYQSAEGGTTGETKQRALGGTDQVSSVDEKGHFIAGFDSAASGTDDGLVKQTRDEDQAVSTTAYGKTESETDTINHGKTESGNGSSTISFGRTESGSDSTAYGKTESISESHTYGQTVQRAGNVTHGEQIATTNEGTHQLQARGNIGVTTSQEMIRQERSIDLFNMYDIIIEDFKMRFCIMVY